MLFRPSHMFVSKHSRSLQFVICLWLSKRLSQTDMEGTHVVCECPDFHVSDGLSKDLHDYVVRRAEDLSRPGRSGSDIPASVIDAIRFAFTLARSDNFLFKQNRLLGRDLFLFLLEMEKYVFDVHSEAFEEWSSDFMGIDPDSDECVALATSQFERHADLFFYNSFADLNETRLPVFDWASKNDRFREYQERFSIRIV